jgi:predicted SnoaL-like aldol condensation-catalyzing enzyme
MSASAEASTDANKETVLSFYELAFREKDPAAAADRFLGETYVQHNPQAPDGPEGFKAALSAIFAQAPELSLELKRVVAEGDLVVLHSHMRMAAGDPGFAVVDVFRVEGARIVEHWDVVQPVPEQSANDNTMF